MEADNNMLLISIEVPGCVIRHYGLKNNGKMISGIDYTQLMQLLSSPHIFVAVIFDVCDIAVNDQEIE